MGAAAEKLALAKRLHQAGNLVEAARLYGEVVGEKPDDAEAAALLGLVCHQQGDFAQAERWYARALALRPDDAEVRFRMGMALAASGRAAEATGHFREVTRLRPASAEAWNNLGNSLFYEGKLPEAVVCYEEAVRLRPGYAEACVNLGQALREDDRVEDGLRWYREAVRLKPDYPKARNNLGVALLEEGQWEEAEAHLRECLRLNPGSAQVLCTLATNGLYRDTDPGRDVLRERLAQPGLSTLDASHLHATLAQLLDRAGDYREAFQHVSEANRLRRELARRRKDAFDPEKHRRFVDRLTAVFTRDLQDAVGGLGTDTEVPVFVVGMPRSGSSLVEQILSSHPDVGGAGELRDLNKLAVTLPERVRDAGPYPECVRRMDEKAARDVAGEYLARVRGLAGPVPRVVDKMLGNFLHLGLVAVLFPRARVLHCRRDPLDTCVSCYFQMFRDLNYTFDLGDLGRYYRDYERVMAHWQAVLPLRMQDVVYEELVGDVEGVSRRLVEFLGLRWDDRCLRFYENPRAVRTVSKHQVRRPVYASSVGRWRRYAADLGPLREALGVGAERE